MLNLAFPVKRAQNLVRRINTGRRQLILSLRHVCMAHVVQLAGSRVLESKKLVSGNGKGERAHSFLRLSATLNTSRTRRARLFITDKQRSLRTSEFTATLTAKPSWSTLCMCTFTRTCRHPLRALHHRLSCPSPPQTARAAPPSAARRAAADRGGAWS